MPRLLQRSAAYHGRIHLKPKYSPTSTIELPMLHLVYLYSCSSITCLILSALAIGNETEPFVAGYDRFFANDREQQEVVGQLLLTELSCTACHQAGKRLAPKGGPELKGVSSRLEPDWIRSYLASPDEAKPNGSMPHLLHQIPEKERSNVIDALVAYLSSSEAIEPKIVASGANPVAHEFWLKGDQEKGRKLYHQIGCIACHAIDHAFQPQRKILSDLDRKIESLGLEPDELESKGLVANKPARPVPMSQVSKKYSLRSLSMFLISPDLVRPAGRMPSLKLLPNEAADIASYLLQRPDESTSEVPLRSNLELKTKVAHSNPGLVLQGMKLFDQLACVNCHATPNVKPRFAKPLAELDVANSHLGCLSDFPTGPRYGLSAAQQNALRASIGSWQKSNAPDEAKELTLKLLQLNCFACHERGGRGGVGTAQGAYFENVQQVDIGDEGRLPPPLDHIGKKLAKNWIQKILEGNGEVRPYFRVRMPVFSAHATFLAAAFVAEDQGVPSLSKERLDIAKESKADLEAGRQLLDTGCVQCHAVRGESLPGSIGIDLADIGNRVQPEWFHAFLLNPADLRKNTRMPSFFPEGKSSSPHILKGDVSLQIASIWRYLNSKDQPLPTKLEQSQSQYFELKPVGKPILLRTFMETSSAGTHAIAVGFPEQHHYAFDARRLRLAEIWKGRFLNAQSTWFDRFVPPAIPLGTERINLPMTSFKSKSDDGVFTAIESSRLQFRGYHLDKMGVPTFRYTVADFDIDDQIKPVSNEGLSRKLTITWFARVDRSIIEQVSFVVVGDVVERNAAGIFSTRSNLNVTITEGLESMTHFVNSSELLIQLQRKQSSFEVRYQW